MLPILVASLNQAAVAQCTHFAVHASVVAHNGRVVAFPADSGGGKSTLAAMLIARGFSYVTDEALVLDDNGWVIPYPKPLALSAWSRRQLGLEHGAGERLVPAGELGGTVTTGPVRITDVVISSYGSTATQTIDLPRSEAVVALIRNSFNHYEDPDRAFELATTIAREVNVCALNYDEPIEGARAIARWLGATSAESEDEGSPAAHAL